VTDTGIGIPKEQQNFIFVMFKKNTNSAINSQGCGLGLTISNMIAKGLSSVEWPEDKIAI
jgi:K+-sensing histidine kinase KdpD